MKKQMFNFLLKFLYPRASLREISGQFYLKKNVKSNFDTKFKERLLF